MEDNKDITYNKVVYPVFGCSLLCIFISVALLCKVQSVLEIANGIGSRKQLACRREYMEAETIRYQVYQDYYKKARPFMIASYILLFIATFFLIVGIMLESIFLFTTKGFLYITLIILITLGFYSWFIITFVKYYKDLFPSKNKIEVNVSDGSDSKKLFINTILSYMIPVLIIILVYLYTGFKLDKWNNLLIVGCALLFLYGMYSIFWLKTYKSLTDVLNKYKTIFKTINTETLNLSIGTDFLKIIEQNAKRIFPTMKGNLEENLYPFLMNNNADINCPKYKKDTDPNKYNVCMERLGYIDNSISKAREVDDEMVRAIKKFRKLTITMIIIVFGIPIYMLMHYLYTIFGDLFIGAICALMLALIFAFTWYGWFMSALVL